jgi:hypothetical protein
MIMMIIIVDLTPPAKYFESKKLRAITPFYAIFGHRLATFKRLQGQLI